MSESAFAPKVIGVKQSRKAILSGRASSVLLADDADPMLTDLLAALCREREIPVRRGCTMEQLGAMGNISVGAAVITFLKD